jgi:hypothetical protein
MIGLVGAVLAIGCEAPPAFPVPTGVRRFIVMDAESPFHVAGPWAIDSFIEVLGVELAKYHIGLEQPKDHRLDPHVRVTLGSVAPRRWQSVDVYFARRRRQRGPYGSRIPR